MLYFGPYGAHKIKIRRKKMLESGICFQKRYFNESLPTGCEEVLIFSQSNETCGKSCGQERKKSSQNAVIKEGWTLYIRFSRPT